MSAPPPAEAPPGAVTRPVARWREGRLQQYGDQIAEEVPVAISCNGEHFAVMMATPVQLEDFALGFALSEGLIAAPQELLDLQIQPRLEGVELQLQIPSDRAQALAARGRRLEGRSGCGLCGSRQLDEVLRTPAPVGAGIVVTAAALDAALAQLAAGQSLAAATGATHAAAWAGADGRIHLLREDVGRHNALDKLIGALQRSRIAADAGFAVVTSRASYEMALKAAAAGISVLAAISAPTALAIALAENCGLTLIGFARPDGCAVYSHAGRYAGNRGGAA
ncbi:formate dehydrogenase accessory sulfurtransferase FdhD [Tahibacter harae]|uniref:Sulfur carrier protein FdhD n=1 Tax=Tahibacter harae TaxID=2963937 RepID=A0ABT1QWS3_9GAMM|nr:formate dehydrogenase accessory sulfurtransferase FdhD [Tahibacter harae]MCQ4166706.1 formate dehydrogenase accessory sulfurtransferase FdhD [Tahibacter harae]